MNLEMDSRTAIRRKVIATAIMHITIIINITAPNPTNTRKVIALSQIKDINQMTKNRAKK